jgi:prepilin-type N-terminal cleavage/methylation domain-containing protein
MIRRGFTLIEVVIATIVLILLLAWLGGALLNIQRIAEPMDDRQAASLLVQNSLDRMLLSGANPTSLPSGSVFVTRTDSVVGNALYTRTISDTILCIPMVLPVDNAAAPPRPGTCDPTVSIPMRQYRVIVSYPDAKVAGGRRSVTGQVLVGLSQRSVNLQVQP